MSSKLTHAMPCEQLNFGRGELGSEGAVAIAKGLEINPSLTSLE